MGTSGEMIFYSKSGFVLSIRPVPTLKRHNSVQASSTCWPSLSSCESHTSRLSMMILTAYA